MMRSPLLGITSEPETHMKTLPLSVVADKEPELTAVSPRGRQPQARQPGLT